MVVVVEIFHRSTPSVIVSVKSGLLVFHDTQIMKRFQPQQGWPRGVGANVSTAIFHLTGIDGTNNLGRLLPCSLHNTDSTLVLEDWKKGVSFRASFCSYDTNKPLHARSGRRSTIHATDAASKWRNNLEIS